mgnify:CR=1 FL=1
MRSVDSSFYKSSTWQKCQKAYMNHANGLCERCLASGLIVPAKFVHHKVHLNTETVKDPELAYGFGNLEALCQECHNKEHFGEHPPKRFTIVDGRLIY